MHQLPHIKSKLGFGSYADRDITSVPLAYVQWLVTNDVLKYAKDCDQLAYLKLALTALDSPAGHLVRSVQDTMPFGRFKGLPLYAIACEYPDYFCWLHVNEVIRCTDPKFTALLGMAIANSRSYDVIDYVAGGALQGHVVHISYDHGKGGDRTYHYAFRYDPACGDDRFDHHDYDHFMHGYEGDG